MHENDTSILLSRCTGNSNDIQKLTVVLNIFKVILLLLYLIWLLIALNVKEFHSRKLVYLYNINVISLLFSIYGVVYFLLPPCLISLTFCRVQIFGAAIWAIAPGYFLAGLALYRLASVSFLGFNYKLSLKTIVFTLSLLWLVPIGFTLIGFFAFESDVFYIDSLKACAFNGNRNLVGFIYFTFVAFIIPNAVIFTAYISVVIRLKLSKIRANSTTSVKHPPRLTIHLLVYIFAFEISLIAIVMQYYQAEYDPDIFPTEVAIAARIAKLLQHYCPLGLLYFHPIMLKQYKRIRLFIRSRYQPKSRFREGNETRL